MNSVLPRIDISQQSLKDAVIGILERVDQSSFNIDSDIQEFCKYLRRWSQSSEHNPINSLLILELHEYLNTTLDPDIDKILNYTRRVLQYPEMIERYRVIDDLTHESSHKVYQLLAEGRIAFATRFLGEFLRAGVDDTIKFILISYGVYYNHNMQKALMMKNEFFIMLSGSGKFSKLDLTLLFIDENFELFARFWWVFINISEEQYSKIIGVLMSQGGGSDGEKKVLEILSENHHAPR